MPYIRTISQLPAVSGTDIQPDAYFEASQPFEFTSKENGEVSIKYASKKIKRTEVEQFTNAAMSAYLLERNGLDDQDLASVCDTVDRIANKDFTFKGSKTFTELPNIGTEVPIETYNSIDVSDTSADYYSVNGRLLRTYTSLNFAPQMGTEFGFGTSLYNINNNLVRKFTLTDNVFLFPGLNKIFENEYIFKFKLNKRISNNWICPASGMFTCYGWLDEVKTNIPNNSARWVALEAYNEKTASWCILQLQPFIPNNFCSYVSFTFPIKAGTRLRLECGFRVGSNSNKYFNAQGSITNHVLNAFIGGVYTASPDMTLMTGDQDDDEVGKAFIDTDTFNKTLEEIDDTYIDESELDSELYNIRTIYDASFEDVRNKIDSITPIYNDAISSTNLELSAFKKQVYSFESYVGEANFKFDGPIIYGLPNKNAIANKLFMNKFLGQINIELTWPWKGTTVTPEDSAEPISESYVCKPRALSVLKGYEYSGLIAHIRDMYSKDVFSNSLVKLDANMISAFCPAITASLQCEIRGYTADDNLSSSFDTTGRNNWTGTGICRIYPYNAENKTNNGLIYAEWHSFSFWRPNKIPMAVDNDCKSDYLSADGKTSRKANFITYLNINGSYCVNNNANY